VSTPDSSHGPRLTAVMREGEQVTPLELFFDLVFVLALTPGPNPQSFGTSAPARSGSPIRKRVWRLRM
jgi:hypothetical protein